MVLICRSRIKFIVRIATKRFWMWKTHITFFYRYKKSIHLLTFMEKAVDTINVEPLIPLHTHTHTHTHTNHALHSHTHPFTLNVYSTHSWTQCLKRGILSVFIFLSVCLSFFLSIFHSFYPSIRSLMSLPHLWTWYL